MDTDVMEVIETLYAFPSMIALVLEEIAQASDERKPRKLGQRGKHTGGPNIFNCCALPNINLGEYALRLAEYAEISHSSFLFGLIYLDRFNRAKAKHSLITSYSIHR